MNVFVDPGFDPDEFGSDDDSSVWIEQSGPNSMRLVSWDGRTAKEAGDAWALAGEWIAKASK